MVHDKDYEGASNPHVAFLFAQGLKNQVSPSGPQVFKPLHIATALLNFS
jgi:hypothetical protein